jgi:hypothetical protein
MLAHLSDHLDKSHPKHNMLYQFIHAIVNNQMFCVCAGLEMRVYTPTWFRREMDPVTNSLMYKYNGEYWDCKEKKKWDNCPNIFL